MTNSDFNNKALYFCNWNRVCVCVLGSVCMSGGCVFVGQGKITLPETDKNTQMSMNKKLPRASSNVKYQCVNTFVSK